MSDLPATKPGEEPKNGSESEPAAVTPNSSLFSRIARFLPKRFRDRPPTVAVVRMSGTIGAGGTFRKGLSLATVAAPLQKAFSMRGAKAVAILINSPGGSPVQSTLIFKRIRALAEEKKRPVFVFCEDVAASGGYLIALAGDEIFADKSSIVGSIGVISAGFGFVGAIEKLGIQRRVYTSGKNKSVLDPFKPENEDDIARLKSIQADVHAAFVALVQERRGERIAEHGDGLFTGEFWAGEGALERGLIDGINDLRAEMRERFGEKVRLRVVGGERGWPFRRMFGGRGGSGLDAALAGDLVDAALDAAEERALWSRFGL